MEVTMFAEACNALWALSALRVAVEHGLVMALADAPRDAKTLADRARLHPTIVERVLDILAAYGLLVREGDTYALTEEGRKQAARGDTLRADIAVTFGQTRALVEEARRGTLAPGWRHVDPEVIRSQATLSHDMSLKTAPLMVQAWPDIAAVLSREGAVMVDVGVGGAGGAIGFCKAFPTLRVVGIDPLPAALIEARANVSAQKMGDRIELRAQRGDELIDSRAFDVAFVPAKFMDERGFEGTLTALHNALKKDGVILTGAWHDVGEPRASAVSRLRAELWGSGPRTAAAVTGMLERAGYHDIRVGPAMGDAVPIWAKP
jgi:hypothetical protein